MHQCRFNPKGGWPPSSPPAIAITVQNYTRCEILFAFASALQTTLVQQHLALPYAELLDIPQPSSQCLVQCQGGPQTLIKVSAWPAASSLAQRSLSVKLLLQRHVAMTSRWAERLGPRTLCTPFAPLPAALLAGHNGSFADAAEAGPDHNQPLAQAIMPSSDHYSNGVIDY
jgi:hypothetical protein